MKKFLISLVGLFCLVAQNDLVLAQGVLADNTQNIDFVQINQTLNLIEKQVSSGKIDAADTSEVLQNLDETRSLLIKEKSVELENLEIVLKKLKTLDGLLEKDGKEPAEIHAQRQEFNLQADKIKTKIASAELANAKIDEINGLILKQRNSQLFNDIMLKESSILAPQEFGASLLSFFKFTYELALSPVKWFENLPQQEKNLQKNNLILAAVLLFLVWVFTFVVGKFIKRHCGYGQEISAPTYGQKLKVALWEWVARGALPTLALLFFLLWLKQEKLIITSDFGVFLQNLAWFGIYYILFVSVAKIVLAPYHAKWRIVELANDKAVAIYQSLHLASIAVCSVTFFQVLASEVQHDATIVYALSILANAIKAFCIIWLALRALYTSPIENDADNDEQSLDTSSKISLSIGIFILFAFGLSLLGYVSLSEFIINKFIGSALIACGFYVLNKIVLYLLHLLFKLKIFTARLKVSKKHLLKIELWCRIILTPLIGLVAILGILSCWGVSVDIFLLNLKSFLIGFNFGGIHISIVSILLGIVAFFISLFVFKLIKGSFATGVLSQIDMDDGIKNSLVAGIGFLGFFISIIIAIAVMGGSFGSIAIIAGALSFGAGLGLQNMVSNLVAGLTILFERPLKPGDWVIINGQEGVVKQINIRSTTLEASNKANIIIPNAEIISSSLVNLTYADKIGRIEINVAVDYDCEVERVRRTLVDIALDNSLVLKNPMPWVNIKDLKTTGLELQLNCFVANVYNKNDVTNAIREQILNRFRELGINFPVSFHVIKIQKDDEKNNP